MTRKRRDIGYRTREFSPGSKGAKGENYFLSKIPPPLWRAFIARCRAFVHPDGSTGISARARILTLISRDIEEAHVLQSHQADSDCGAAASREGARHGGRGPGGRHDRDSRPSGSSS